MLLTWSIMEFDGDAVSWLHAEGTRPSTWGSSGIFSRTLSSLALKSSIETLVVFLICMGRQLNNWGPLTWKDCSPECSLNWSLLTWGPWLVSLFSHLIGPPIHRPDLLGSSRYRLSYTFLVFFVVSTGGWPSVSANNIDSWVLVSFFVYYTIIWKTLRR